MTELQAVLLGVLQGLTEFLPVSSSGHLVVVREFMNIRGVPIIFDIILHISTMLVVILVFRKRIGSILLSLVRFFKRKSRPEDMENLKLVLVIIIGSVFTAAVGYGANSLGVEAHPRVVSLLFIVTGGILIIAHRFGKGERGYAEIGVKTGLITGIAQGFGVFPGISRSGITISASLLSGMTREKAGEYSFLLSIPAILGALVLKSDETEELSRSVSTLGIAAGAIASFAVGLVSLLLLLRLVKSGKLHFFAIYLIPLGIFGFLFL
jgi:undecaprenyl-diphosphatase